MSLFFGTLHTGFGFAFGLSLERRHTLTLKKGGTSSKKPNPTKRGTSKRQTPFSFGARGGLEDEAPVESPLMPWDQRKLGFQAGSAASPLSFRLDFRSGRTRKNKTPVRWGASQSGKDVRRGGF